MSGTAKTPGFPARNLILGILVLAWFSSFTFRGIFADFSNDDVMNLDYYDRQGVPRTILGTFQVITSSYRPLGGLFYLALYKLFGLNPLPFRVACFALLLANLILFYRFFSQLSGRRDIAWIALFLVSYHAWFVDLYYSTGTIYELLCVFFYLLGFTTYVKIRSSQEHLRARDWLIVAGCYAASLDAKELAVTFPLFIGFYEIIYHPPDSIRRIGKWILLEGRGFLIMAAATIPYLWVKTAWGSLAANPSYALRISPLVFVHTFQIYLNPFLYFDHVLRGGTSMILLFVLLFVAVMARQRCLLFGWLFLLLAPLPFIFIPHYCAFFFYLPALGWALVGAGLLVLVKDLVLTAAMRVMRAASPAGWKSQAIALSVLLIPLGSWLALRHYQEGELALKNFMSAQVPISPLAAGMREKCADVKAGTILWFARDPFPRDRFTLEETIHLTCGNREVRVVRGGEPPKGKILGLEYDGKRVSAVDKDGNPLQ